MEYLKLVLTLLAFALATSALPSPTSLTQLEPHQAGDEEFGVSGERDIRDTQGNNKKKKFKGDSFKKECLAAHNKWRREHGADELKLDPKLTLYAQSRADFIANSDGAKFEHLKDSPYGENLAWHTDVSSSCTKLSGLWYDEISDYDFAKPAYNSSTGHFTQMVWRETSRVGCARQVSTGPQGGVYLVCNYDPPGNFLGEFRENVLPAGGAKRPPPPQASPAATSKAPATIATERAITVPSMSTTTTTTGTELTSAQSETPTTERPPTTKPKSTRKKKNKNKKKKNKKSKKNKRKKGNKKNKNNSTTTSTEANRPNVHAITTTLRPLPT